MVQRNSKKIGHLKYCDFFFNYKRSNFFNLSKYTEINIKSLFTFSFHSKIKTNSATFFCPQLLIVNSYYQPKMSFGGQGAPGVDPALAQFIQNETEKQKLQVR